MNYRPYYYRQCDWPFKLFYNSYHAKHFSKWDQAEDLFHLHGDKIVVQGMWRMQLLGELHSGLWAPEHDDYTNWEYYDELMWQTDSEQDREELREEHLRPDTYAEYFEQLAEVAAEIGCERAEIKCLVKSLMLKYRIHRMGAISDFPHETFCKLYHRLVNSNDMDQLRVAERLAHYHVLHLDWYMRCEVGSKRVRLTRRFSAHPSVF